MTKRLARLLILLGVVLGMTAVWWHRKHAVADVMHLPVMESTHDEYSEPDARLSGAFGRYHGRALTLVRHSDEVFDLILEPRDKDTARVVFKHINLSFFVASQPAWTREHRGNATIALVEREWNRQQVLFDRRSPFLEMSGGDGWERTNLVSADLVNNGLGAGAWEVMLFTTENGARSLYYHGWFQFPLGHYSKLVERFGRMKWSRIWARLEHWIEPEGTMINLGGLRAVEKEEGTDSVSLGDAPILAVGEQCVRSRTCLFQNVRRYDDFYDGRPIHFASLVPPGRYDLQQPWETELRRIGRFESAMWRRVKPPARGSLMDEIELRFRDLRTGEPASLVISGFDVNWVPPLPAESYPVGFQRPLGIGVPPLLQDYDDLTIHTPWNSSFFAVLLDDKGRWLNHRRIGVDGVVMLRDEQDPALLHLYLAGYEQDSLVGHLRIRIPGWAVPPGPPVAAPSLSN